MKKYNFNETYLTESFFDDIEDDIDNTELQLSNDINKLTYDIDGLTKSLQNIIINDTGYDDIKIKLIDKNNILTINMLTINPRYNYTFEIRSIAEFQKWLNLVKLYGFNTIRINQKNCFIISDERDISPILDFRGLTLDIKNCNDFRFANISIKNVNIINAPNISISNCDLNYSNTVKLQGYIIDLIDNKNLYDFSFIQYCITKLIIRISQTDRIQQCYNFTGLPDGKYDLYYQLHIEKLNNKFTLIGLPDNLNEYSIKLWPIDFENYMNHFSYEGITPYIYEHGDITIDPDANYSQMKVNKSYNVHIGKYDLNVNTKSTKVFKLPKRILNYMIKYNDYKITCHEN